jgi:hypothetical protein
MNNPFAGLATPAPPPVTPELDLPPVPPAVVDSTDYYAVGKQIAADIVGAKTRRAAADTIRQYGTLDSPEALTSLQERLTGGWFPNPKEYERLEEKRRGQEKAAQEHELELEKVGIERGRATSEAQRLKLAGEQAQLDTEYRIKSLKATEEATRIAAQSARRTAEMKVFETEMAVLQDIISSSWTAFTEQQKSLKESLDLTHISREQYDTYVTTARKAYLDVNKTITDSLFTVRGFSTLDIKELPSRLNTVGTNVEDQVRKLKEAVNQVPTGGVVATGRLDTAAGRELVPDSDRIRGINDIVAAANIIEPHDKFHTGGLNHRRKVKRLAKSIGKNIPDKADRERFNTLIKEWNNASWRAKGTKYLEIKEAAAKKISELLNKYNLTLSQATSDRSSVVTSRAVNSPDIRASRAFINALNDRITTEDLAGQRSVF